MFWQYLVPFLFFLAILVQCIYLLGYFKRLIKQQDNAADENTEYPSVSVIVAAWNELPNLKRLLPLLDAQDYPNFEIIVADDRSSDGTYDYLLLNEDNLSHLRFVRVLQLPEHFTAKKYAVTMAIKKSVNELILTTDADCLPQSDQWIRTMVAQLTPDKDIVVGYSPYYRYDGWLNALIRYETFQTAIQYLSFALAGFPFMGVGRNLLYRKSVFWQNNGFKSHAHLLSGDDDLFINEVATATNVAICTSSDAWTFSEPKETWPAWITQKRRHLSVGKRYQWKNKLTIGFLWMSQLISWLFLIPALFASPSWFTAPSWSVIPAEWLAQYGLAHFYPFNNWMRLVAGIFIFWLLLRWFILSKLNRKLGSILDNKKIIGYDFLYTLYLVIFGAITTFSNPQKIKWR